MGRLLALCCLAAVSLTARTGPEHVQQLLSLRFDVNECYRVRDLFLERDDAKFYFTDGFLIFAEPYQGREVSALFVARESTDTGELLVIPPTPQERYSVARYVGEGVLNEKFRHAMMFFTDDTADELRRALERGAGRRDAAEAQAIADAWSPVLRNILEGLSLRVLNDLLSQLPLEQGFFAAAVGGGRLGRFDVVVDPRVASQFSVGQSVSEAGRRFYEIWCQFEGRTFREGQRTRTPSAGQLGDYRIEVSLTEDLEMQVEVEVDFQLGSLAGRTQAFELAHELRVSELEVDGAPADFVQLSQSVAAGPGAQNDVIFLIFAEPPAPNQVHRLRFRYAGRVISRAGRDVFFVRSRSSWYPRAEASFSHFDLTFHYPSGLDLVATGDLVDQSEGDGVRTSRYRTADPIRLAGFNLGAYETSTRPLGDYTIVVTADRHVENRLRTGPSPMLLPQAQPPRGRAGRNSLPSMVLASPSGPDIAPADRIARVSNDSVEAFEFFLERFGPPPVKRIVISPIPGDFGQGFPGLVYASTLSYFDETDPPLRGLSPDQKTFYTQLLRPHEISHQWWGNAVFADALVDNWMMEALATYSSLMFMEHRHGVETAQRTLRQFRARLLARNADGDTVESAGPIVLGERLRSSKFPTARLVILYEKGAWIVHMLRGILGDEKFIELLRNLPLKYRGEALTTAEFQREAAALTPPDYPDPDLELFFETWVRGTGIPRWTVSFEQRDVKGGVELNGVLLQRDAPAYFSAVAPIAITTADGRVRTVYVVSQGEETEFSVRLDSRASSAAVDPSDQVLRRSQ